MAHASFGSGPQVGSVSALPTASAAYRGVFLFVLGTSSTADVLYVCLKSATNTYSWKTVSTG